MSSFGFQQMNPYMNRAPQGYGYPARQPSVPIQVPFGFTQQDAVGLALNGMLSPRFATAAPSDVKELASNHMFLAKADYVDDGIFNGSSMNLSVMQQLPGADSGYLKNQTSTQWQELSALQVGRTILDLQDDGRINASPMINTYIQANLENMFIHSQTAIQRANDPDVSTGKYGNNPDSFNGRELNQGLLVVSIGKGEALANNMITKADLERDKPIFANRLAFDNQFRPMLESTVPGFSQNHELLMRQAQIYDFLIKNFDTLAARDGDASTLSTTDILEQGIRQGSETFTTANLSTQGSVEEKINVLGSILPTFEPGSPESDKYLKTLLNLGKNNPEYKTLANNTAIQFHKESVDKVISALVTIAPQLPFVKQLDILRRMGPIEELRDSYDTLASKENLSLSDFEQIEKAKFIN